MTMAAPPISSAAHAGSTTGCASAPTCAGSPPRMGVRRSRFASRANRPPTCPSATSAGRYRRRSASSCSRWRRCIARPDRCISPLPPQRWNLRDRWRAAVMARTGSTWAVRRSTSVSPSTSRSTRRYRRWHSKQQRATPGAAMSAERSTSAARKTGRRQSGMRCSSTRWFAWPQWRSSTLRAAASKRSPGRFRHARARNTTARGGPPAATSGFLTRSDIGPTRS